MSHMNMYNIIFNKYFDVFRHPLYFVMLSFVVGYMSDIAIEKGKVFGESLNLYYKEVGSGLWGGLAIMFSVIISYIIQFFFIPLL